MKGEGQPPRTNVFPRGTLKDELDGFADEVMSRKEGGTFMGGSQMERKKGRGALKRITDCPGDQRE